MATEKRLIDANALTRRFKVRGCFKKDMLGCMVAKIIDTAPTVDAVEVVRCKDCKKREICRTTNIWAVAPDDEWFCADGERRTDA